jgi:hypothetical protein
MLNVVYTGTYIAASYKKSRKENRMYFGVSAYSFLNVTYVQN